MTYIAKYDLNLSQLLSWLIFVQVWDPYSLLDLLASHCYLIFVTLSTIALAKAFFPGPFRVCEDEVSGFVCPNGQEPFPYVGEECSRIRSGADLPRPRDLIGRNPCKGLSEVKKIPSN